MSFTQEINSLIKDADNYAAKKQYVLAITYYKKAISFEKKIYGPSYYFIAQDLQKLAEIYLLINNSKKAEFCYREAIAIEETVLGKSHIGIARILADFASLYSQEEKYVDAIKQYQKAKKIYSSHLGSDNIEVKRIESRIQDLTQR